jgi:NitT/TauT family transport system permease protein
VSRSERPGNELPEADPSERPARESARGKVEAFGVLLGVALIWEVAARLAAVDTVFFPAPSVIAVTLARLAAGSDLWGNVGITLARVGQGVVIGCVPGCALGLAMGRLPRLNEVVDPLIGAFQPTPKIAILPLVMVIFGLGETSKVAVAALAAFFPMVLAAAAGVRQIHPLYFEVARSLGAGRRKMLTRVTLPGSLPMLLTGLRLAFNVAFVVTLAAELTTARRGLGAMLWLAWQTMRTEELWATLVVVSLLGVAATRALTMVAVRLAPWQAQR